MSTQVIRLHVFDLFIQPQRRNERMAAHKLIKNSAASRPVRSNVMLCPLCLLRTIPHAAVTPGSNQKPWRPARIKQNREKPERCCAS